MNSLVLNLLHNLRRPEIVTRPVAIKRSEGRNALAHISEGIYSLRVIVMRRFA